MRKIVRPDGATIAYDVAGDGPPVIFLHGLTNRRQGWGPVTSLLVPAFTCVRIDFRGHGESTPAPDYSMPSLVAAVYAALNPACAVVCVDPPLLRFAGTCRPRSGPRAGSAGR